MDAHSCHLEKCQPHHQHGHTHQCSMLCALWHQNSLPKTHVFSLSQAQLFCVSHVFGSARNRNQSCLPSKLNPIARLWCQWTIKQAQCERVRKFDNFCFWQITDQSIHLKNLVGLRPISWLLCLSTMNKSHFINSLINGSKTCKQVPKGVTTNPWALTPGQSWVSAIMCSHEVAKDLLVEAIFATKLGMDQKVSCLKWFNETTWRDEQQYGPFWVNQRETFNHVIQGAVLIFVNSSSHHFFFSIRSRSFPFIYIKTIINLKLSSVATLPNCYLIFLPVSIIELKWHWVL